MRRGRQFYYNIFSGFYDQFVAAHSSDSQEILRQFFADHVPVETGQKILDICTGTGSLLSFLSPKVGATGLVVGIDFSRGMLEVNRRKNIRYRNIVLGETDVARLPFKNQTFDAVTCTHAFYELKGKILDQVLEEILRVLKPGKAFVMMEHDVPQKRLIKGLFYIRMLSMGAQKAVRILKHEKTFLERYFNTVEKISSPSGRSKIYICRK